MWANRPRAVDLGEMVEELHVIWPATLAGAAMKLRSVFIISWPVVLCDINLLLTWDIVIV